MRLIDANLALRKVEQIPFIANENKAFHEGCRYMQKRALRIFHESRAIDAVPVVRCKDCKHITPVEGGCPLCTLHNIACAYDGFCSEGELKDGDGWC